ncbi:hypothetical protein [Rhodococcus artemisiae]|uniref:DUF317 domain-containing protein n=1 Tax=Rhodococcus artemisiae TaxID=714159 RepID=A0ABU7LL86_9NOCA|nr:hypothetical protein [Rhodococcus artemisiae]MEE2062330.1 hypothetical protein [Rhodococcus artemisiae]
MPVNYPAADPTAGAHVRPERILRTRSLSDEVLIALAHQVAAHPHATPPVSWRLEDGVLVASDAAGERVWVTAIDRWDGDFLRYTRRADTDGVVAVLDWPTDFDESEVIARDARAGLASLSGDVSARP